MIMLQKCAQIAAKFRTMQDATTFPTNESDCWSKVNKVRKIFVKPGEWEKAA